MFVSLKGFKARYYDLTLVVVSEFNEWRVLLRDGGTTIHGTHQFSEAKAKEHALAVAQKYIHEYKHGEVPVLPAADWVPTEHDDWLVWHA